MMTDEQFELTASIVCQQRKRLRVLADSGVEWAGQIVELLDDDILRWYRGFLEDDK